MRVLVVTKLFPNAVEPLLAPFNRLQLAALGGLAEVRVLGTLPWFPANRALAKLAGRPLPAAPPAREIIDGLEVWHPRTLYIPKVGLAAAPALYMASLLGQRSLGALAHARWADVILGCWAYPDGVAALGLGALAKRPVVVKVHGTDINDLAHRRSVRPVLTRALPRARRVVAVSKGLVRELEALGVPSPRIALVPNGVDRSVFAPRPQVQARRDLAQAVEGKLVLYVGALKVTKGVRELFEAFASLAGARPDLRLTLVGGGELRAEGERLATRHPGRVYLPGPLPAREVAAWMAAADVVTLPSWNEGTPNVLIEAMASGRPVVATHVGGIPDLVRHPGLGCLVPPHDSGALRSALERVLYGAGETSAGASLDPQEIASFAPGDWRDSARQLLSVLKAAALS